MAFGTLGSFPQGQRVFGESPLSALLGLVLFPLLPELPPWAVFWRRFAAGNYDSLATCGSEFEFSHRLSRAGLFKFRRRGSWIRDCPFRSSFFKNNLFQKQFFPTS